MSGFKKEHGVGTAVFICMSITKYSSKSHLQVMVRSPARKISASLALEKKMLSIVDVFAIFPCP